MLSGPCVSPLIRDGGIVPPQGWTVAPAEQDCEKTCQSKPLRARSPHKVCLHTITREERAAPHHLPDAVRPLQTAHQLTWLMHSALTAADRCRDKQKQHWPTALSVCVDLWLHLQICSVSVCLYAAFDRKLIVHRKLECEKRRGWYLLIVFATPDNGVNEENYTAINTVIFTVMNTHEFCSICINFVK